MNKFKLIISTNLSYKNCYLENLDINNKFDFIFAFEVIEHIEVVENKAKFIKNLKSLLDKDGILIISTINKNIFAKLFLLDFAENLLGLIPQGTHNYESFIE